MKKCFVFCLCMSLVVLFSACKKDGVYIPKKKIQKIYKEENGVKSLGEVWHWDGNLLSSIDIYDNSVVYETNTFHYDGDRLITVRNSYSYMTYSYNGERIKSLAYYFNGQEDPAMLTEYKFEGNKLSEMKLTIYNYSKELLNPLKYLMPQLSEKAEKVIESRANESKGIVVLTAKMNWSGHNVAEIETITEINEVVVDKTVTQNRHDNKKNPYYGLFCTTLGSDTPFASDYYNLNNTVFVQNVNKDGSLGSSFNYEYLYEDDYPVKASCKSQNPATGENRDYAYYYEYK